MQFIVREESTVPIASPSKCLSAALVSEKRQSSAPIVSRFHLIRSRLPLRWRNPPCNNELSGVLLVLTTYLKGRETVCLFHPQVASIVDELMKT